VRRNKNDAADAAAICEAVSRLSMRFVEIKSEAQQAAAGIHKVREMLMKQRTLLINALRGLMAELGIVVGARIAAMNLANIECPVCARAIWLCAGLGAVTTRLARTAPVRTSRRRRYSDAKGDEAGALAGISGPRQGICQPIFPEDGGGMCYRCSSVVFSRR
jgi:hypothetical protein